MFHVDLVIVKKKQKQKNSRWHRAKAHQDLISTKVFLLIEKRELFGDFNYIPFLVGLSQ